jgi:enoyl-CoA hydratase/carnithine racemase
MIIEVDDLAIGVWTGPLDRDQRRLAQRLDLALVPPEAATDPFLVGVADPVAEGAHLRAMSTANPQSSAVLAQVLRAAPTDPVAALHLESFAYSTLLGGAEFARWLARRGPRPAPPVPAEPVLLDRDADTLHVTLNHPARRNAYGARLRDAFVEALRLAVLDRTITRVVVDGAGPVFCSGGDLDEFGTTPDLATAHFIRTGAGAAGLLDQLADRTEFHVHGTCVGAGIELPAFARRLLAAPGTTFRLPEVGMGLIPGAGGTVSLARRIGRSRTLYLALSGKPLDTTTALDWGLVDGLVTTSRAERGIRGRSSPSGTAAPRQAPQAVVRGSE